MGECHFRVRVQPPILRSTKQVLNHTRPDPATLFGTMQIFYLLICNTLRSKVTLSLVTS